MQPSSNPPKQQLYYPLDKSSVDVLSRALDKILPDKIFDLLWRKILTYQTTFESSVGFDRSDVAQVGILSDGSAMRLNTKAIANDEQYLLKLPEAMFLYTFSTKSAFRSEIVLTTTDTALQNMEAYFIVGDNVATFNYYGFRIRGNVLYGVSRNSGAPEAITTLKTSESDGLLHKDGIYRIEARYTPTQNVIFFVDGSQVGAISGANNLPDSSPTTTVVDPLFITLTTLDNVVKTLDLSYYQYQQGMNRLLIN